MERYLYGAAVQGIQSFIFRTNELKDIVGASELVEQICTSLFQEVLYGDSEQTLNVDPNAIVHAAGNIKYVFQDADSCGKLVRVFPKKVLEYAPGITVSQAVVHFDDQEPDAFSKAITKLEERLKVQRNRPMRSLTVGLMGIERSRQTGLPVLYNANKPQVHLDASTWAKRFYLIGDDRVERRQTTLNLCEKLFFGVTEQRTGNVNYRNIAFDLSQMTGNNNWLAIIHADGNGLGRIVMKVGTDKKLFHDFSQNLDKATTLAAHEAYTETMKLHKSDSQKVFPFRPVVIGGDDLTVICRADLALDFTHLYLEKFEKYTNEFLKDILAGNQNRKPVFTAGEVRDRLTACAGIVYMKSSFPFYAAYDLAESLCGSAKKDAKRKDTVKRGEELPASCLKLHKIQDSFTESDEEIVKRELTSHYGIDENGDRRNEVCLDFGPYYLRESSGNQVDNKTRWTIDKLKKAAKQFESKEGNALKSSIRQWTALLLNDQGQAIQFQKRMSSMVADVQLKVWSKELTAPQEREGKTVYPAYDVMTVFTVNSQITKE